MRTSIAAVLLVLISSMNLSAATYHVALTGNDAHDGSADTPWRTLGHAAGAVAAGDTVLVADGDYGEVVRIAASGNSETQRIIFRAANRHQAVCKGFNLQGDYISIDGFTIEADAATIYGIYAQGRSHLDISHCLILECPGGGINLTLGSTYARVVDNKMDHNGQWGIHIVGSYCLIEDNEVLRTVQHHPKLDFTGFHGEDADGMRLFGDHHTIRGNYLHDLGNVEDPGNHQGSEDYPDDFPHVDCFQSWDRTAHNGRPVLKQSVIENNVCRLSRASGKGVMISALDAPCGDITIRNNIFEYRDIGVAMNEGTFENVSVYHNVFKARLDDLPWGAAVAFRDVNNYAVVNNIMVDGHAEARKIIGGSGIVDYNLVWYSDGSTPAGQPGAGPHELWGVDPLFVDMANGNFNVKSDSPAIDHGQNLPSVSTDCQGHPRPSGNGWDIGAYEQAAGGKPTAPSRPGILKIK